MSNSMGMLDFKSSVVDAEFLKESFNCGIKKN